MEKNRYSLRTVGNFLGITAMSVVSRSKKLGIDTSMGLSAEGVKRIRDWKPEGRHVKRGTTEDLRKELEGME